MVFFLTCRENKQISRTGIKQISCTGNTQHLNIFLLLLNESQHHNLYLHFIHTWVAIPCSTLQICPSWPRPQVELSTPLLYPSCLSWLTQQLVICPNDSYFRCAHPLTTRRLNTIIQVNNMGAWYIMYNEHIYIYRYIHYMYNVFSYASSKLLGRPAGPELSCQEHYQMSVMNQRRLGYHIYGAKMANCPHIGWTVGNCQHIG
jgi:hypothetical protein